MRKKEKRNKIIAAVIVAVLVLAMLFPFLHSIFSGMNV